MDVYLVGGAVRDALLGLPVSDRDWVVVGGTAEVLLSQGYQPVGQDFPVYLHPDTHEEYALARTERKSGQGYKGFTVSAVPTTTLEEDLMRRDLTVNAIAQDSAGQLIDPYGGIADLNNRLLRHISAAFAEDPLRVLRVARFAARFHHLGFRIAPETVDLMTQMTDEGALQYLVAERVWQETWRALSEPSPWVYLETLRACGALAILMPEWDSSWRSPLEYDPNRSVSDHLTRALAHQVAHEPSADIGFALMCHGARLSAPCANDPTTAVAQTAQLCERLKAPNKTKSLALLCTRWMRSCHQIKDTPADEILALITQLGALKADEQLLAFIACCWSDFAAQHHQAPYPMGDWLTACVARCRAIGSAPFIEQGLRGPAIGQHMADARIEAIAQEQATWQAH